MAVVIGLVERSSQKNHRRIRNRKPAGGWNKKKLGTWTHPRVIECLRASPVYSEGEGLAFREEPHLQQVSTRGRRKGCHIGMLTVYQEDSLGGW